MQFEKLEAHDGEDGLTAKVAANGSAIKAFERKRPSRKAFLEHLWRERVLIADTLEVVAHHWQVIQTVRGEVYLPRV